MCASCSSVCCKFDMPDILVFKTIQMICIAWVKQMRCYFCVADFPLLSRGLWMPRELFNCDVTFCKKVHSERWVVFVSESCISPFHSHSQQLSSNVRILITAQGINYVLFPATIPSLYNMQEHSFHEVFINQTCKPKPLWLLPGDWHAAGGGQFFTGLDPFSQAD